ncbi:MAG: diguanylate cyclase [Candidatus Thiodiazotropha sp. (ex Troendleina suluensis)]|nr:diguanylate cyclase [Candidatus Thiodiazotropha sp. (ex Troendleina suluensis)]
MPINKFLLLLAGTLVAFAVFFQWKISADTVNDSALQVQYRQALEDHRDNNIYYTPQATIQWIVSRQNPAGYFIANPDMLFEPSQLNNSTLRGTRYAISTLSDLDGLGAINRNAIRKYLLSLYQPEVKRDTSKWRSKFIPDTDFAGFKTLPDKMVGVRPTMDALITLDTLNLLDDPRLNLERIWNFIASHQNPNGGFWDEHYPTLGTDSSIKCTSFSARALTILSRHMQRPIPKSISKGIEQFVLASYDNHTDGYRSQPGKSVDDSYNAFRAFISIWDSTNGSAENKRLTVHKIINMERLINYFNQYHYLPEQGVFSRYSLPEKKKPSVKATHLIIWLLYEMHLLDQVDKLQLSHYIMSQRASDGQFGGDIYTTYSSIGLLQKLGIPTAPSPEPEKPEKIATVPGYVPTTFFLAALITLFLGYQAKKFELETINKALTIQASIDGLTGIYNRQKFEAILQLELQKAKRYKRPLTTIMFDVDNFKQVNDRHGHPAGDCVLIEITNLIKAALRDSDFFARWGGEEFIILSPETELDGAKQLVEKLRNMINETTFSVKESISASFGVTVLEETDTIESLVSRSDNAMLEAKRRGKDHIRIAVSTHAYSL